MYRKRRLTEQLNYDEWNELNEIMQDAHFALLNSAVDTSYVTSYNTEYKNKDDIDNLNAIAEEVQLYDSRALRQIQELIILLSKENK